MFNAISPTHCTADFTKNIPVTHMISTQAYSTASKDVDISHQM